MPSTALRTASSESLKPKIEIKPTAKNNEESLDSRSSNNLSKSCSSIYGVNLSCLVLLDFPISLWANYEDPKKGNSEEDGKRFDKEGNLDDFK